MGEVEISERITKGTMSGKEIIPYRKITNSKKKEKSKLEKHGRLKNNLKTPKENFHSIAQPGVDTFLLRLFSVHQEMKLQHYLWVVLRRTKQAISYEACSSQGSSQEIQAKDNKESKDLSENCRMTIVHEICHRPIENDDMQKLFEVAKNNGNYLHELKFRDCGLKKKFLINLLGESKKRKIQVEKFSMTVTDDVNELLPTVCELMSIWHTDALSLEESDGDEDTLRNLHKNLKKFKVRLKTLDMSYNTWIDLKKIRTLLENKLESFKLVNCDLQPEEFEGMKVRKSKVDAIDISFNCDLDHEAIGTLPDMMNKDKPLSITMQGCELSEGDLDGFNKFEVSIWYLDLSFNDTLESTGIGKVGAIARKHKTEEVSVSSCNIDVECVNSLLSNLGDHKLKSINLSQNLEIGSCLEEVAKLFVTSHVKFVDLSDCKLTSGQIRKLCTALKDNHTEIESIDLSDCERRRIDVDYMKAICNFSKEICTVNLALPQVSETQKEELQTMIDDIKEYRVHLI